MVRIQDEEPCPCDSDLTFGACHGLKIKEREPDIRRHVKLPTIPEPDPGTRAVFEYIGDGTIIFSGIDEHDSLDCGGCGSPLAVGVSRSQFNGPVLKCKGCGAFNAT